MFPGTYDCDRFDGGTGTGKTRSIKGLDPETTAEINVLNKPLSFREAKEYKNVFHKDKWDAIVKLIRGVPDKITNLILDDIGYVMTGELFERASETGFNKFTEIGKHMQQILYEAINMRPDLNIFFMFHTDDEYSDKVKVGKKLKTIGQLLEDKYDPLGVVTISLFTEVSWKNTQRKIIWRTSFTLPMTESAEHSLIVRDLWQ